MKLPDAMFAAILMNMLSSPASAAATCESLTSFSLPQTTITLAQTVAPGEFAWPHDFVGRKGCLFQPCPLPDEPGDAFKSLPTFCRIAATLKPTNDSDIKIEIWIPASGWNGKFIAVGNGIIAGAPANNTTHLAAYSLWVAQAVHRDEASYIPPAKYPLIHNTVLEACDALDGVKDGVLEDPTRCKFDPKVLECKGADAPGCLTAPQVEAVRKIYTPATNPRTKQQILPALEAGSELGWAAKASPQPSPSAISHWRYVVFKDPNWDYKTFNFDSDVALGDKIENDIINATSPDLKAFFGRGGKLLRYHGWSDPAISPRNSINYYKSVLDTMGSGSKVNEAYRLFMVPGMGHCSGGDEPNQLDTISALEQWVEKGKTPAQIIASRIRDGKTERTRPLCPYPKVATYKGTGSTDDAANFSCSVPK